MPFSDTTNKNGIIQAIEFWTGLGDAYISGDTTQLKIFTARVNEAFERLMPLLLSYTDHIRWDDVNNSDIPVGTFNLVSAQSGYTISQDDNTLDILNITDVRILPASGSSIYQTITKMSIDDPNALSAMSPNSSEVGIPTYWLERGNTIFFYPQPNYSATAGAKIFFERQQSVFLTSDTTKEAGIPRPFIGLLPLYAAYDWLIVNTPENVMVIQRIEAQIAKREQSLKDITSIRYPTKANMAAAKQTDR